MQKASQGFGVPPEPGKFGAGLFHMHDANHLHNGAGVGDKYGSGKLGHLGQTRLSCKVNENTPQRTRTGLPGHHVVHVPVK